MIIGLIGAPVDGEAAIDARERDCPVLPCVPFTTVNADLVRAEDMVAAPPSMKHNPNGWDSRSSSSRRRN